MIHNPIEENWPGQIKNVAFFVLLRFGCASWIYSTIANCCCDFVLANDISVNMILLRSIQWRYKMPNRIGNTLTSIRWCMLLCAFFAFVFVVVAAVEVGCRRWTNVNGNYNPTKQICTSNEQKRTEDGGEKIASFATFVGFAFVSCPSVICSLIDKKESFDWDIDWCNK